MSNAKQLLKLFKEASPYIAKKGTLDLKVMKDRLESLPGSTAMSKLKRLIPKSIIEFPFANDKLKNALIALKHLIIALDPVKPAEKQKIMTLTRSALKKKFGFESQEYNLSRETGVFDTPPELAQGIYDKQIDRKNIRLKNKVVMNLSIIKQALAKAASDNTKYGRLFYVLLATGSRPRDIEQAEFNLNHDNASKIDIVNVTKKRNKSKDPLLIERYVLHGGNVAMLKKIKKVKDTVNLANTSLSTMIKKQSMKYLKSAHGAHDLRALYVNAAYTMFSSPKVSKDLFIRETLGHEESSTAPQYYDRYIVNSNLRIAFEKLMADFKNDTTADLEILTEEEIGELIKKYLTTHSEPQQELTTDEPATSTPLVKTTRDRPNEQLLYKLIKHYNKTGNVVLGSVLIDLNKATRKEWKKPEAEMNKLVNQVNYDDISKAGIKKIKLYVGDYLS